LNTHPRRRTLLATLLVGTIAARAGAAPPPFTLTSLAKTGNSVLGTSSTINSAMIFPPNGGRGFLNVAVNNAGSWLLDADTQYNHNYGYDATPHECILSTQLVQGPFTPYILQGAPGYLTVPVAGAVSTSFFQMSMNNTGDAAFAMSWAPDDFSPTAGSGVFFNNNKVVFLAGDVVLATGGGGLAAGTVWNAPNASTRLTLNDANQLLVVSTITESSVVRRAAIVIQLDASGNALTRTLIAKEGGPVGPGGGASTWTTIAGGPSASAMNNSGVVVFSGTTSAGVDGIYSTAGGGGFVAVAGGPSPDAGVPWGSLVGSPLDVNTLGVVAFKGTTGNGTGTYTESTPDAGEVMDSEDHTYGNGPLNLIVGNLLNDQDADLFRITVTDPNTFSATTVPDPGSGFPGASFDTVLTLIGDPGESGAGSTPGGRTQCDNVSPTVLQSTITGSGGRTRVGGSYFLAISTPKARIGKRIWHYATDASPVIDGWSADPAAVAVNAGGGGGLVYWPDPSAGTIRSATTAGVLQSDMAVPAVIGQIAIDSAAGKIYWADSSPGRIRRSNLDGSSAEDVIPSAGVGPTNSTGTLYGDASCTGLTLDTVHGKVYWTRSVYGEINVANLDGSNPARVRWDNNHADDNFPATIAISGTFAPGSIAIDTSAGTAGKVFWANTVFDRIERCDLGGTGRATVLSNVGATAIAVDSAAGKLYWTNTASGKIQRANLNGTSVEDVALSPSPIAITLDTAGGFVYWTNTLDRVVRRASLAGPFPAAASNVVSVGPDTGERSPDGPARPYSGYLKGWTRFGTPGTIVLPYQIKLTGATFQFSRAIIAKGPQRVAAVGDAVPGIANSVITQIAPSTSPIKLSDRGDVLWKGSYYPVYADNVPGQALFLNADPLVTANTVPAGTNLASQKLVDLYSGPNALHMSASGEYAVVQVNMQDPPYNFTLQRDNALLFQFSFPAATGACCNATACSISTQAGCTGSYKGDATTCGLPGNPTTCCPANFNQTGGLSVQDIFDFLGAWFAGDPRADFNHVGGLSVQDIFDFLGAWFAGCQ
jgi:low density lipoprotein receptor-related protein 5/6